MLYCIPWSYEKFDADFMLLYGVFNNLNENRFFLKFDVEVSGLFSNLILARGESGLLEQSSFAFLNLNSFENILS